MEGRKGEMKRGRQEGTRRGGKKDGREARTRGKTT